MSALTGGTERARLATCETCADRGWLCAATGKPADFERGTCCEPGESEEFGLLGPGCPSADGCPDCGRARSLPPSPYTAAVSRAVADLQRDPGEAVAAFDRATATGTATHAGTLAAAGVPVTVDDFDTEGQG